jgi:AcrR family transcriptional regulator
MFETFEKLPESRRQEILQICIEEFVENGYKNASTNTIVKRLGISKGLLFLYFSSKKNLYLYLVEYLSKVLTEEYLIQFGSGPVLVDVFDNLGEFYKSLLKNKPERILFILEAFLKTPEGLKEEVEASHSRAHDYVHQYLENAGFREGVDIQLVVDLMHMISGCVGQLIFEEYRNKDISGKGREEFERKIGYFEELFGKYMDILKYGVIRH